MLVQESAFLCRSLAGLDSQAMAHARYQSSAKTRGEMLMRAAALGFLGSSVLLATAPTTAAPMAIQGGALALLGWMVWYLLAKALPAHYKAAAEERKAYLSALALERENYLEVQGRTQDMFCKTLDDLSLSINLLSENLTKGT